MSCNYKHAQDWTDAERCSVLSSFARHIYESKSCGIPWAKFADADVAMASIDEGRVSAVIVDQYILVYVAGCDWYCTESVIVEQMLINMEPWNRGEFSAVLACLDALALEHGCKSIVTGNGILRPGLARLYQGAGYVRANEFYIKEVP